MLKLGEKGGVSGTLNYKFLFVTATNVKSKWGQSVNSELW